MRAKFINETESEYVTMIHVTTPEKAKDIKIQGFKPKAFIEFNYYSSLGKNGIYFYDNRRWVQIYAYFLKSKTKVDKVALIFCDIPKEIIQSNDKSEDGYFVRNKDLSKIVIKNIELEKPNDIY